MATVEFDEVRFPTDVSYGSSGGPIFKTQVFEGYSGTEKRNIDWASPMMQFDVAYGIKTDAQMSAVIEFFNAREGKLRGFRYKNWANYQISNGIIAVGNGLDSRLPLIRTYGFPATQTYKRLYKIVQGSVTGVSIGAESLTEGEDFVIDYNSGEIIFETTRIPGEGIPVKAVNLEFDEPVRFDTDDLQITIEAFNNNSIGQLPLVGIRDKFTYGTLAAPDAATASPNEANDPYFGSTRLILKFDDVTVPSTTVDSSRFGHAVALTAPCVLITSDYAAGGGAIGFGVGGYLAATQGTKFDIADPNVPYTIETFIKRPEAGLGATEQLIFGKWDTSGATLGYALEYRPSQQRLIYTVSPDGSAETVVFNYPWTEADADTWQHISIDRLTTGLHVLRINGYVAQTALNPGAVHAPTIPFYIGGYPTPQAGEGSYQGAMDSFRFTYGRNRYSGVSAINPPQADYPV